MRNTKTLVQLISTGLFIFWIVKLYPYLEQSFYSLINLPEWVIISYCILIAVSLIGILSALFLMSRGGEIEAEKPMERTVQVSNEVKQVPLQPKANKRDLKAFNKLIGLDDAKMEVQDFFDVALTIINDPEKANRYELKAPKGVLLYGPPGTGKTAFARACARYYGLPLGLVKGSEILAGCSLVGQAEQALKDKFDLAQKKAPCLLFFDEIDAIAQNRSGHSNNSPSDVLLNNLLTEIDGYKSLDGVFIMAATNRKDILDPALIRPGRLEKHIEIGLPNREARKAIIEAHLGLKPVGELDLDKLADMTEGKNGAFLEAVVNRANYTVFREEGIIAQEEMERAIQELW